MDKVKRGAAHSPLTCKCNLFYQVVTKSGFQGGPQIKTTGTYKFKNLKLKGVKYIYPSLQPLEFITILWKPYSNASFLVCVIAEVRLLSLVQILYFLVINSLSYITMPKTKGK